MRRFLRLYLFKILLGLIVLELAIFALIKNVNHKPVAGADEGAAYSGKAVVVKPLKNDSDKDEQEIYIAEITQPFNGEAEFDENSITYKPAQDFIGRDSFQYRISDGKKLSKAQWVSFEVAENLPPLVRNDSIIVVPGRSVTLATFNNDDNRENDSIYVTYYTQPSQGSVEVVNNEFIFTSEKLKGATTFEYKLSDGFNESETAVVTIMPKPFTSKQFGSGYNNNVYNYEAYNWQYWDATPKGLEIVPGPVQIQGQLIPGAYVYLKDKVLDGDFDYSVNVASLDDFSKNNNIDYVILFAYQNNDNFSYVFLMNNPQRDRRAVQLLTIEDGSSSSVSGNSETTFTNNKTNTVRLKRTGSTVQVFFNGNAIIEADHDAFAKTGSVGFGSRNDHARFSNVKIK